MTAIAWRGTGGALAAGYQDVLDSRMLALLVASAALFYVAPSPLVYVPALLVIVALAWLRPDLALVLVPLFAPYFMVPKHIGSKQFAPSEIFLLVTCSIALGRLVVMEGRTKAAWTRLVHSPFFAPCSLFLVAAVFSTIFAVDRHHALQWLRVLVLEPVLFFAVLVGLGLGRRQWELLLYAVVAAGVSLSLIGLFQYAFHLNLSRPPGSTLQRIQAVYGSPDNLGLFLDRAIPTWLSVAILARFRVELRMLWWSAGPVLCLALLLTYSRGAWVATLAGCLVVLAAAFRRGRYVVLALIGLAALGLALRGPAVVRAFRTGHAGTAQVRVDIWRSSTHMVRDHPLLGIGPDNFQHYFAPTRKQNRWQHQCAPGLGYIQPGEGAEPCLSHPHNEIFDFWLSTGLLGLLAFAWLQVVFWRRVARTWTVEVSAHDRPLVLGVAAAMAASLIHGLVDNSYFLNDLALVFWLLCGYVTYVAQSNASPYADRKPTA